MFTVQLIDAVKDLRRAIPGADDISPEMDQLALAGRFENLGHFTQCLAVYTERSLQKRVELRGTCL